MLEIMREKRKNDFNEIVHKRTGKLQDKYSWAFASQAGDRGSIPGRDRPKSLKRYTDSSTAKRSATCVSVTVPQEMTIIRVGPCHSRCGTLKNPHFSLAMSAEQKSKLAALHRLRNGDVSKWVKQTNKQPLQSCL